MVQKAVWQSVLFCHILITLSYLVHDNHNDPQQTQSQAPEGLSSSYTKKLYQYARAACLKLPSSTTYQTVGYGMLLQ